MGGSEETEDGSAVHSELRREPPGRKTSSKVLPSGTFLFS